MPDRPISPQSRPEEVVVDAALRPRTLAEMVGQDRLRENLEILIQAARRAARRWITYSCMALRAWAKLRWPTSSAARWALG